MRRDRSTELYAAARAWITGGVNSPAPAWTAVGGEPLFIAMGKGSRVWDVDGNEYIDHVCSWGPMILGHAQPEVIAAIKSAVDRGTSFGVPTEGENELAQLVVDAFPSIDTAIRQLRHGGGDERPEARTGVHRARKDREIRGRLPRPRRLSAGLGRVESGGHGVPTSAGVTRSTALDTLVAQYNDLSSMEAYFDAHPDEIAGIIVEPVTANMGVVPPQPGFLEGLRKLTTKHGALLIFDEVITGFRVAYGGAQALYNVAPDITCLGKIIGGGLPVGAYGGRREIMETVSPLGPMYQA